MSVTPKSQRVSFPNEYGKFTTVQIIAPKNANFFIVRVDVRKPQNESIRIKQTEKRFPLEQYADFISDLEKRSGKTLK